MKKILLLSPLLILLSCGQPKDESKSTVSKNTETHVMTADDSLQAIIKENINKQPTIDTVFLGFTFGMTQKQITLHLFQLAKDKKFVRREKDNLLVHPMTFDLLKADAMIAPKFNEGKMYEFTLVVDADDDIATPEDVYRQTVAAYMKKYEDYKLFQEADLAFPTEKCFHWIKNNLHIYIRRAQEVTLVSYINMPEELLAEKKKSDGLDSSKTQTQKDL